MTRKWSKKKINFLDEIGVGSDSAATQIKILTPRIQDRDRDRDRDLKVFARSSISDLRSCQIGDRGSEIADRDI